MQVKSQSVEHVHGFSSQTRSVGRKSRYRELPTFKLGHPGAKMSVWTSTMLLCNNITGLEDLKELNRRKTSLSCYVSYASVDVQNSITRASRLGISKLRTFWKGVSVIYKLSLGLREIRRPQGH